MDASDFNLRHLAAMVAAAESGSLSAAARRVNLTQPAITQGVSKLERGLGLPLFERRPGGMEPTDAARILAPRAAAALALIGSSRVTGPQMRAFMALARGGSYVAAAAATGIREASLHRAVADLALGLGHRLVERRGRGIALTARGLAVARRFRLAEAELKAALSELAALQGREIGRIAIGAMPLSRARLLPNAVAAFHRAHPQVDLSIAEGSHVELVGPLRDGEIDLMLGALRDPSPGDDLVQTPLFVDRPVVLGRSGHPLAGRGTMPAMADLARFAWVVPPEGTPLRAQWRRMFDLSGVAVPRVAIESGSVIVVRQLLIQTDFLTLLSPDQVAVELEAEWICRIGTPPGDPHRTIGITARAGWRPTPLQRRFVASVEAEAKRIIDD
ncbi:LysR family transcriptional regulator [Sphingosinicella sp. BN140058]|uniref:LysR family transcriptional regulator n=1 Tax=Sphingosinicella sp. BN140058 TaxID=1892855 RepID=UPI00101105A5|nr:LysR family transcriptional regulator [Sphingosinicella sp. BN140058]QAY76430.1 LysR family transcriptional regulator [Sphingosinicella sp. BN140058]